MRRLRLSVIGIVVALAGWIPAFAGMTGKPAGMASGGAGAQGSVEQTIVAKPLRPFTAKAHTMFGDAPAIVYWDMDKVRVDYPGLPNDPTAKQGYAYMMLLYKTGRFYNVTPNMGVCTYDVLTPKQLGCLSPLSSVVMSEPLPQASAKTKITVLGTETVAGLPCTVERITSSDPNIAPPGGSKVWFSKDLGIVVKFESPGPNGKLTTWAFFDQVTLGKPDPKLFVPPAYCKFKAGSASPCQ